jgi:hypothetical protein
MCRSVAQNQILGVLTPHYRQLNRSFALRVTTLAIQSAPCRVDRRPAGFDIVAGPRSTSIQHTTIRSINNLSRSDAALPWRSARRSATCLPIAPGEEGSCPLAGSPAAACSLSDRLKLNLIESSPVDLVVRFFSPRSFVLDASRHTRGPRIAVPPSARWDAGGIRPQ